MLYNPTIRAFIVRDEGGISARNDDARDIHLSFPLHLLLAILGDIADCLSSNSTVVAGIVNGQKSRKHTIAGTVEIRLKRHRFLS